MAAETQSGCTRGEGGDPNFAKGQDLFARAVGFRTTANDLQTLMNSLATGSVVTEQAKRKLIGYFLSVTVLRALAAECMLKALAFARTGRFDHGHNLSALYEALDGKTRGCIEKTADSHGVASPKRVLKRHKDDFVDWRYPADGEQKTGLLDLDRTLSVLDTAYRQIANRQRQGTMRRCMTWLEVDDERLPILHPRGRPKALRHGAERELDDRSIRWIAPTFR